ncbi:unnamed protein product [Rotaria socialis]
MVLIYLYYSLIEKTRTVQYRLLILLLIVLIYVTFIAAAQNETNAIACDPSRSVSSVWNKVHDSMCSGDNPQLQKRQASMLYK